MPPNLPKYARALKAIPVSPDWDEITHSLSWLSPLDIDGVTIAGLQLRMTAQLHLPDEALMAQLEYHPFKGKPQQLVGRENAAASISEIHARFTRLLPDELRWVENPDTLERIPVVPGEMRTRDAQVGTHIAVSPGALPRFMRRFEERYADLANFEAILAVGPAHHRLLYIHPFADGNGRVTRLASYAVLLRALDTGGLWSIARGLARREKEYKAHLSNCDQVRQSDRDGRGHLSEMALNAFAKFFLEVCVDQVKFMEVLMQPKALRDRILSWSEEEIKYGRLPERAPRVLDAILFKGSMPRSEVASVVGQSARSATNITNALCGAGIIRSSGARADWQLSFPAKLAPRIAPGLFPETSGRYPE